MYTIPGVSKKRIGVRLEMAKKLEVLSHANWILSSRANLNFDILQ